MGKQANGGKARAKVLTPTRRREIAQQAAKARWATEAKPRKPAKLTYQEVKAAAGNAHDFMTTNLGGATLEAFQPYEKTLAVLVRLSAGEPIARAIREEKP